MLNITYSFWGFCFVLSNALSYLMTVEIKLLQYLLHPFVLLYNLA